MRIYQYKNFQLYITMLPWKPTSSQHMQMTDVLTSFANFLIFSFNMKCSVSYAAFIILVAFETRLCSTPEATAWNYQPKSISFSKSTRASRSHTSNSPNTFRIERNLFICGEISPSPGQERTRSKPKYMW